MTYSFEDNLPLYSVSEPSPSYSSYPSLDEYTIESGPRHTCAPVSGSYTKKKSKTTVTLFEQEDGKDMPLYRRGQLICGAVYIEEPHHVIEIKLQIKGRLSVGISDNLDVFPIIDKSHTIWSNNGENEPSEVFPIEYRLPLHFTHDGADVPLPPTFHESRASSDPQGYFALDVKYIISVQVTRNLYRNIGFLNRSELIKIPFKYCPRTRPHLPILQTPFLSSVKALPDEWIQVIRPIKTRLPSNEKEVICHLFIPRSRVYGLTDRIPVHVQLTGSMDVLRRIVNLDHSGLSGSTSDSGVRVRLVRQNLLGIGYRKTCKNAILGEAELRKLPGLPDEKDGAHLDWEGGLQCHQDVDCGEFSIGSCVTVKDSIVLSIEPRKNLIFLPLQVVVPVRLVTDTFDNYESLSIT